MASLNSFRRTTYEDENDEAKRPRLDASERVDGPLEAIRGWRGLVPCETVGER